MGVSENRLVPLNPMVLLIIIPMKNGYFIGKINPTFSDKPIFVGPRNINRYNDISSVYIFVNNGKS